MDLIAYHDAREQYRAALQRLADHIEACTACYSTPPLRAGGTYYCARGRELVDAQLRARTALDAATRNCASGFCIDCD